MSNAVFPTLPGLTWDIEIEDITNNLSYQSPNWYSTRIPMLNDIPFRMKLKYNYLRDGFSSKDELNTILGFWRLRLGDYDSFLVSLSALTLKAADSAVTAQVLPLLTTNDGTYYAQLLRSISTGATLYNENVYQYNVLTSVSDNGGVVNPLDYEVVGPSVNGVYGGNGIPSQVIWFRNNIGHTPFAVTPPITATFSWYYRMRFEKGTQQRAAFMYQLYEMQEVDLVVSRDFS